MNTNDLRVIKTRRNIESSFLNLLNQKDFHQITVQDILDNALINRSTFYKHYEDKNQLAQTMCSEVFELFVENVENRFHSVNSTDILIALEHLYQVLSCHSLEILSLFRIHTSNIHLYDDMFLHLAKRFTDYNKGNETFTDNFFLDYMSTLYASLVMTSIKWSLEHNGFDTLRENIQKHSDEFMQFVSFIEP